MKILFQINYWENMNKLAMNWKLWFLVINNVIFTISISIIA